VTSRDSVFRIGLLGHGTVGAAFASLLPTQAERIERLTGLRPELAGVMTRSRGSFDELLEGSDLIVELMGGIDPARDYVLRAIRAGRHIVTANKQLLSRHGEELWDAARSHGVQLRF
jgi:homoserine dehydrogenase